jgi:hypothetical protein
MGFSVNYWVGKKVFSFFSISLFLRAVFDLIENPLQRSQTGTRAIEKPF